MSMIRFKNKEEFDYHYRTMAGYNDEELNDDLCIEGNSGTKLGWLRDIAEQVGYENISVDDYDVFTDTVEIDVSKNPQGCFELNGSEVSYCNGIIRIWWD